MEFGKIELSDLDQVDFTLPEDRGETTRLLAAQKKAQNTSVYVGCAKWGRKDWIGKIYPAGTKESDFLSLYSKHFNSIELNASFYRLPTPVQTSSWQKKVGSDFLFCPKVSQVISHIKRLKDVQELSDRFVRGIRAFGGNLGPVLLMPHPAMGPKTADTISAFISSLPSDIRVFVELRHKGWFEDPETFRSIFDALERHNAGSVITDAAGRRDCVHMRLTTPEAFIRFVGNGLHATDYTRVDAWVGRIKQWIGQGIQKIYFFMHQQEEVHSPELARYVIMELNKHCGLNLNVPHFIPEK